MFVLCLKQLRHKPINFQRLYRLTFQHSHRSSFLGIIKRVNCNRKSDLHSHS